MRNLPLSKLLLGDAPGAIRFAIAPYGHALRRHAQMQAGLLLQIADDGKEIFRLRIAARAEHEDQNNFSEDRR